MSTTVNIERPEVVLDLPSRNVTLLVNQGGLVPISDDVSLTASVNLSALRAVTTDGAGAAVYASNDTVANAVVVGITFTAASAGQSVQIKTSGIIEDAGWTWTKGAVFLGTNGTLTQSAPTGGAVVVQVGRAITPTKLQIDIEPIIETV